jgi:hypothetical protein
MEGGVEYAENALKPVINHRIDQLALRAQQIALDRLIDDKLAALRRAGEDLKVSVNDKVDNLMIQASDRRPDQDDPHYDEKIKIYKNWLEQVTEGIRHVHSFFDRIWIKVRELLDKVFKWVRDGVAHLAEKISKAFLIVKTTLFR